MATKIIAAYKPCAECGINPRKHRAYCAECFSRRTAANFQKRKALGLHRESHFLNKYGVTLEGADTLRSNPCEICGRTSPEVVMCLDHTINGSYHGVLCNGCNSAIGLLRHDPERIERASAYVRRTRKSC